jgi:phosphomannomutase
MSDAPLMLGVSGLRGIVGKSLTPEVAARFAGTVGSRLVEQARRARRPVVVLGYDGRLGGSTLSRVVGASLLAAGCDLLELGITMTPSVGHVVDAAGAAAGVMITASHNPQEWNGIKLILRDPQARSRAVSAAAPPAAAAEQIIARFRAEPPTWQPADGLGESVGRFRWMAAHERSVVSLARQSGDLRRIRVRKFRVALDTVAGSGRIWGGRFLEALGAKVHELYPTLKHGDGRFPHMPEPTRENLWAICRAVKRTKSQIGFAQDPDADRLAIVDERGEYIGEEYTLALAAKSLLSASKPSKKSRVLVANLSTSRMIDDIAAAHGARVVRTPVGEANVVEAMKREKAAGHDVILGGEGNGGVIWPKVTYVRDSLSAMALVLALMARTGKKVSELVAAIPAYAIEKRKVDLARKEDARPAIDKIAAAYRDQTVDLQDGVRIDWPARRAWLHVRASNTEPIMRLIAESPTAEESRRILDEAARVIAC